MTIERHPETGFNDHSEAVEISKEDRLMGPKIYDLFTRKFMRPLPWAITGDKITVYKKFDAYVELETAGGEKYIPDLQEREIITKGLEKEQISPGLARLIAQHKMVEDFLSDFTARNEEITRNNMGLNMSGHQWTREEMQHGLGLGLILEATGHKTSEEIKADYYANLERTWEPPFATQRKMVIYPDFQENNTAENYGGMEAQALKEGAPITAKILRLIKKDEIYHGVGYQEFVKLYYEEDPEGTLADVLYVAKNFKMPVQNLIPNRSQALFDIVKYGGFTRERVAIDTIQKTLRGFEFVPEPLIKEVVSVYLKN